MEKPILYTDEPMVVGEVIPDFPRPDQLSYPPKRRKCGDMQISEDIRLFGGNRIGQKKWIGQGSSPGGNNFGC